MCFRQLFVDESGDIGRPVDQSKKVSVSAGRHSRKGIWVLEFLV